VVGEVAARFQFAFGRQNAKAGSSRDVNMLRMRTDRVLTVLTVKAGVNFWLIFLIFYALAPAVINTGCFISPGAEKTTPNKLTIPNPMISNSTVIGTTVST